MATPLTELLEEESALECILSEVGAASPEETPLADALGRYPRWKPHRADSLPAIRLLGDGRLRSGRQPARISRRSQI